MNPCAMPQTENPSRLKKFWRERVVGLIGSQLTQGVTPQKIALTVALGINLAMFPILGSTTLLCAAFAFWFKLNQPIIQLVNWPAYPLQFAMLLPFVRLGEWLLRAPGKFFHSANVEEIPRHARKLFARIRDDRRSRNHCVAAHRADFVGADLFP